MLIWKSRIVGRPSLLLLGATAVSIAGAVSTAWAAPGDHVRVGDTVLTPSILTGFEYHSNAYLLEGGEGAPPVPGSAWTVNPRFAADLEGQALELHYGLGWTMKKFIDLDS